jgi:hypothetical protein
MIETWRDSSVRAVQIYYWGGILILGSAIAYGAHKGPLFKYWLPLPCTMILVGLWLSFKDE